MAWFSTYIFESFEKKILKINKHSQVNRAQQWETFFRQSRVLTLTCAVLVTVFTLTDRTLISKMEKKESEIQNIMKLVY